MFVAVFAGTIVLLLLGGGWLIVVLAALLVLLALAVVAAYAVRWHELPLPWLLSRFLTYKTGVRVAVGTVRVRALQSAGRAGAHAAAQTHAVATAEHIVVDNPPGYATRPLSVVGSVEVLFNPWSVLSASVHVQSIHIEAVQVVSLPRPHPRPAPPCRHVSRPRGPTVTRTDVPPPAGPPRATRRAEQHQSAAHAH
jgi:hypothetical protein